VNRTHKKNARPRRRLVRNIPYLGLHLGLEYHANHRVAGKPMNDLVRRHLRDGDCGPYFQLLVAQVRCFGDPRRFWYDDVSRVRAGGKLSEADVYEQNVRQSARDLVAHVERLTPRIIVVAGDRGFTLFMSKVLPRIPTWRGHLIKARNPSARGHWGRRRLWLDRYTEFSSDLMSQPRPDGIRRWHMLSPDSETPFDLVPLR